MLPVMAAMVSLSLPIETALRMSDWLFYQPGHLLDAEEVIKENAGTGFRSGVSVYRPGIALSGMVVCDSFADFSHDFRVFSLSSGAMNSQLE